MKLETKNINNYHFADINTTTALKGIAILIIFFHHVGVNGYFCHYFNPLGGIGVAMFLFLSGFGISESYKKSQLSHYWRKKIVRILIPYLIWIPLYYITMHLSTLGSPKYFETIPRYWFIEYLLIMYAAFYFIFPLKKVCSLTLICSLCIILFLTLNNLRAEQSLSFWAGVLFSLYKEDIAKLKNNRLFAIALLLLVVGFIALLVKQQLEFMAFDLEGIAVKTTNMLIKLPVGMSIILFILAIKNNNTKWLAIIGGISYELYLTHIPFFMTIDRKTPLLLLFIIQSVFLAYILHGFSKLINKIIAKHD